MCTDGALISAITSMGVAMMAAGVAAVDGFRLFMLYQAVPVNTKCNGFLWIGWSEFKRKSCESLTAQVL